MRRFAAGCEQGGSIGSTAASMPSATTTSPTRAGGWLLCSHVERERRFLRLCTRHGLPKPEVNVRVGPYEVDFLWRSQRLIVETDGYETHGGRAAFQRDKTRDARLRVMGYSVQRFAFQHIVEDAAFVAGVVRALL